MISKANEVPEFANNISWQFWCKNPLMTNEVAVRMELLYFADRPDDFSPAGGEIFLADNTNLDTDAYL
jgi:hypothetical protein